MEQAFPIVIEATKNLDASSTIGVLCFVLAKAFANDDEAELRKKFRMVCRSIRNQRHLIAPLNFRTLKTKAPGEPAGGRPTNQR
jgi:hypothetical protein